MAAGLLLKLVGFCFWAVFWLGGAATVSTNAGGEAAAAAVVVDARSAIAVTDEDFVCATLDWWPPDKCDYGTCSWGLATLLNMVCVFLSFLFFFFPFPFHVKLFGKFFKFEFQN
jgi:heparanase 1